MQSTQRWVYFSAIAKLASSTFFNAYGFDCQRHSNFMEGDIMKELRRIISMLMILVLFIGILPMNLGVVKAEAELETNKIKDIRARVYDGNKWEEVRLTAVVYIEGIGQKEFITEFINYLWILNMKRFNSV